jgi:isopenicillin N synthase-like dioxygenase
MSGIATTGTPLYHGATSQGLGDFHTVPVIDFSPMGTNDAAQKFLLAEAVREVCTRIGFFYIANHGIPPNLVTEIFGQGRRFFELPTDTKMRLHMKKSAHLLGYIGMHDENADPLVGKGDVHEAFDFVPPDLTVDGERVAGDFRHVGNQWPEGLPGFQESLMRYSVAIKRLSKELFGAFALSLRLPENYFRTMTNGAMTLVRFLHYPSQPGPLDKSRLGIGQHTDHECFTILSQDDVQALQVQNRRGDWIEAPRIPGTFVVNIGDQMARWTNGLFSSTLHRVANFSGRARYSIASFVGANADAVVEALPSCVGPGNPPKYSPVIAKDYVSALVYRELHSQDQEVPSPREEPAEGPA